MRTREQIIADCEKRFEELRAEKERRHADPLVQRPCHTCAHALRMGKSLPEWTCCEPLVKGFGDAPMVGTWRTTAFDYGRLVQHTEKVAGCETYWRFPMPCGPEKALWQPKPPLCQRIIAFLTGDAA